MRFLPVQAEKWIRLLLRSDVRMVRRMPAVLLLIAAGLTAWMLELGAVLHGQAQVRNWSSVWVGLDLMEIAGLVMTAVLLRRRSAYLAAVAALSATLFAVDAWFDLLTAAAGADWYESVAAALFGEVPMTGLLAAVAIWASRQGFASCRRARLRKAPYGEQPEFLGCVQAAGARVREGLCAVPGQQGYLIRCLPCGGCFGWRDEPAVACGRELVLVDDLGVAGPAADEDIEFQIDIGQDAIREPGRRADVNRDAPPGLVLVPERRDPPPGAGDQVHHRDTGADRAADIAAANGPVFLAAVTAALRREQPRAETVLAGTVRRPQRTPARALPFPDEDHIGAGTVVIG
jgi:hypothetical protein